MVFILPARRTGSRGSRSRSMTVSPPVALPCALFTNALSQDESAFAKGWEDSAAVRLIRSPPWIVRSATRVTLLIAVRPRTLEVTLAALEEESSRREVLPGLCDFSVA